MLQVLDHTMNDRISETWCSHVICYIFNSLAVWFILSQVSPFGFHTMLISLVKTILINLLAAMAWYMWFISNWDLVHAQVVGYSGGCCKSYSTKEQAMAKFYGLYENKRLSLLHLPWRHCDLTCYIKNVIILVQSVLIVILLAHMQT